MCVCYFQPLAGAFKRCFSETLDTMGKRLIGRKDVNLLGSFPGLKMRMICATFHCAGKYPLSKTALNNFVRYLYFFAIIGNSLRIDEEVMSNLMIS
jgi:hypothetical protein